MALDDCASSLPPITEAPHLFYAYHSGRQQMLVQAFVRELYEGGQPGADVEALAERLIDRYSDDVLNDLLIVAERIPHALAARWVRSNFSRVLGQFGMALRASAPEYLRHNISQVLQVAVLMAEHRMNLELSAWLGLPG